METHHCYDQIDDTPPVHAVVTDWLACGLEHAGGTPALQFNNQQLSYNELECFSNQVARRLAGLGVNRGDRVGLCMNRSFEMIAVLIAILKNGAAYVPLDPAYPPHRLGMMTEDASLRLLVVHADHAEHFNGEPENVIVWENMAGQVKEAPGDPVEVRIDPEDVAYVIFTSGSTGRPKGIAMPHRALSNLIEWQLGRRSFKRAARVLQYSSISFDVSFQEISTTLASEGTLILVSDQDRRDPRILLERLDSERVERLFLPYVAMRSMIEAAHMSDRCPDSLREVVTAGEQLLVDDSVRTFFGGLKGATLDNQYGPSETHVISAHLLEDDPWNWPDLPPIGTPLTNNSIYILDEHMQPVEPGKEGELYLAGRNLALGYLHREEATRQGFVSNPLDRPQRPTLYRTGDLGAVNEDGSINFLGRKDYQVKIRGHRVEPGEINATAARFRGIEQCLTHTVVGKSGSIRLATWYVAQKKVAVDPAVLRRHLSEVLPEHMVPAFLQEIDAVPYTPSGKVDLKALPAPNLESNRDADADCPYESAMETALAAIWSELLELGHIPRTADFFELGGDSLQAVTLFLKIKKRFGFDLPLATLAQAPTIEQLAHRLEQESGSTDLLASRSLQMIQPGIEGEIPLILVHGGRGNVLVYNNLVRSIGSDLPVYGLQWSGWDGRSGERTVPAMARFYKNEILRLLPHRSFRLGGYCIGALIAIEMAGLFEAEGIEVAGPLLAWDAPNIRASTYHAKERWDRPEMMEKLDRIGEALMERTIVPGSAPVSFEPEVMSGGLTGRLQRVPYLRELVQWTKSKSRIIPRWQARLSGRPVPVDRRESLCLLTMLSAIRKYDCPVYPGPVLFFRSHTLLARKLLRMKGWWEDPFFGFGELCGGSFETYVVGGPHHAIMDIQEMGSIIRKACHLPDRIDTEQTRSVL